MLSSFFHVDPQVTLVTKMSSSLKVLGSLLFLLFSVYGLLVNSQKLSWKEFMKQHHLSTSWDFSEYRCKDLMKEIEAPKDKNYHIFIYTLWYKIEHICIRNWRDRYRNVYIWTPYPFKILKCYPGKNKKSYKEHRSHSYIEFHCGVNGFVDSIEDTRLLEVINK
ncbi:epididymal secretory protein E3-beta [Pteronotus mesoamericanus]|uniref:epididymal secretory protein E3-beta n=1 Tax=Pteronotus mesoamericanus TaxID=1884717 RepID=UPI0023ED97D3|nr:epididymal secretory protein E3-beta [Pteronotus parnellii mesoamericanus]